MAIINGTGGADDLIGTNDADVIKGLNGDDTLYGAGGADRIEGGSGDDTIAGGHNDGAADTLLGGVGDDFIIGGLGDSINGGADYDILYFNAQGDSANRVWNLNGATGVATATLNDGIKVSGMEFVQLNAGTGNDSITLGDAHAYVQAGGGNDTIIGGVNDDYLKGQAGNDSIDGGAGFDRAGYFGATSAVRVSLLLQGASQGTGGAGADTLLNIEALSGTAFADTLTGDDKVNWLWGGSGNDTLAGDGGDDLLSAGFGDQSFNGGKGLDTVGFWGGGADNDVGVTINLGLAGAQATFFGAMTLAAVENLSGSIVDDAFTGTKADNVLLGDAGSDVLNGAAGNDRLYGDGWTDAYDPAYGLSAAPATFEGARLNLVEDYPALVLTFDDVINGGAGNDTISGGLGADSLTGGSGSDRFRFLSVEDSNAEFRDLIADLNNTQDTIDLSVIDANSTTAGDEAFVLVGAFTGVAGQLTVSVAGGVTTISGDVDGDAIADLVIEASGNHATFTNFVL